MIGQILPTKTTSYLAFGKWDALTSSLNPSQPVTAATHPCHCFTAEVGCAGAQAVPLFSVIPFSITLAQFSLISPEFVLLCSLCVCTVSEGFLVQFQQIITRFCGGVYTVNCGEPSDHVDLSVLFFQKFTPP